MSDASRLAIVAALLLGGAAMPAFAQANLATGADLSGPRAALDHLLALNGASAMAGPEGQALLTGELARLDHPSLGPLVTPDALVALAGGRAVARIPAHGDDLPDLYLYLRRKLDGRWTIEAARTLAVMEIPRELRRTLRAMPNRTAELEAALRNAELTLASDRALRIWFGENRGALERLRRIAEAGGTPPGEIERVVDTPEARQRLQDLHAILLRISHTGVVSVTIGGILENSVGFLHASDPDLVPAIDPSDHIWIEPVGDGWYLFKTT
jgi:hypothetical protein